MKEITHLERIKRFGLTCALNDNGVERHFHHGHEYVEIGGVKWATCNVGAEKETDCGKYFAWGETKGYTVDEIENGVKSFSWENYELCNGSCFMTKYNETDDKSVLEPIDDAVVAAWGNGWRMPTTEEYAALGNAVNTEWTNNYQGSGVAGMICTDKTDSSKVLFFPACGLCGNCSVSFVGSNGGYWSSSLYSSSVHRAYYLRFYDDNVYWQYNIVRYGGFPVRGVVG